MPSGFKIMDDPPNCLMAISNDILVLVDGFSNIIAIDLPLKGISKSGADLLNPSLFCFLELASSIIVLSSCDFKSDMFKKFLDNASKTIEGHIS